MADPITAEYDIHVETFKGIVELTGFVETTTVRAEALQVAGCRWSRAGEGLAGHAQR